MLCTAPLKSLQTYTCLTCASMHLLFMQGIKPWKVPPASHPKEAARLARYEADETPMVEYLNASNVVEQRRRAAREAGGQGPRTIVRCPAP